MPSKVAALITRFLSVRLPSRNEAKGAVISVGMLERLQILDHGAPVCRLEIAQETVSLDVQAGPIAVVEVLAGPEHGRHGASPLDHLRLTVDERHRAPRETEAR